MKTKKNVNNNVYVKTVTIYKKKHMQLRQMLK